uniref:Beta propeller domain-containing protein n=1 Tax=uncultured Thiotrichaceae bacterium TaxID=298394 RepID=A0A6S6SBZ6_9GAMM|nr:MAG: Beta propeller domain-containing protein [uncultured Thiotrichaceae bacterium]
MSLFDVRNPRKPAEIDKLVIGKRGTDSPANRDHHAFTSLAMNGTHTTRVALPVSLVEDEDSYDPKTALHRFEVDRNKRKIRHLGAMKAVGSQSDWWMRWNSTDRSIIIDDRLYYYHGGHFRAGSWK